MKWSQFWLLASAAWIAPHLPVIASVIFAAYGLFMAYYAYVRERVFNDGDGVSVTVTRRWPTKGHE